MLEFYAHVSIKHAPTLFDEESSCVVLHTKASTIEMARLKLHTMAMQIYKKQSPLERKGTHAPTMREIVVKQVMWNY